ncbi:MAG: lipoate--protein ligase family protein [Rhodobacteraceae bacterium]|nr:lipoate--protein ligase family protein [Paracoccaceae bacterium]
MHGEYKVPGGKLVVADLHEKDGRIAGVQISGDFFLEPAEALEGIRGAVTGLSVNSTAQELAAAIRQALPDRVQMFGFSPEAVALAVRRALGKAKTWQDFEWQVIDAKAVAPRMHVALDEVLAKEVAAGRRAPALRFWEWDRASIIIGAFQSLQNEVDVEAAKALGVEIIRRASGGGAMFVEKGTAITYSIYAPIELVEDMSFADSYAFLDTWVLKALNALGVEASYMPLNDITSPRGKIGGAAQKRFMDKVVLHHVTMAYNMDAAKMMQVLRIGREKMSDKGTASAARRVDPVRSQTGMERRAVIESMKKTFLGLNGGTIGDITDDEYAKAEQLIAEKYGTDAWLNKMP